ncbi:MAG: type V CRISPR-associated protein Cas12b, partial [bacterium]
GLCRLPDLRILSVDLGHRYAAACAVWQVLSQRDLEKACEKANAGLPEAGVLSFRLKEGKRTVLYRRIAMDAVKVDETTGEVFSRAKPHPGPWARLDRQFLVKLQGEDEPARVATSAELAQVNELEKQLGRLRKEERKGDARRVDALQVEAADLCRQGLRLHADAARIAFHLTAKVALMPGGKNKPLDEAGRAELLADTLALWRSRFGAGNWQDAWAKRLWEEKVQPHLEGIPLEDGAEGESGRERKGRQTQWKKHLLPLVQDWSQRDLSVLSALWKARWTEDEGHPAKVKRGKSVEPADGWYARLRWLHDWLLPRGAKAKSGLIRDVGGLSLGRIAVFKALYQLQKAHRMRPEPTDLRKNVPVEGDSGLTDYGLGVLDAMERLRQNRVKQLASRLAASALGLGKDLKALPGDPRFAACQAVVVENLERYRPEEVRTRRENRQLMDWSSAKVWKYLSKTCELNGLHLRAVSPAYTSRQDSRTGSPGRRCQDVDAEDFFREAGFWAARVRKATENPEPNGYDKLLTDIWNRWKGKTKKDQSFRLPVAGGELFVSADRNSPSANGLQADLNAAANIGLRALLDPDWPGAWWYVPSEEQADGSWKPVKKDVQGGLCPGVDGPLIRAKEAVAAKRKKTKGVESETSKVMNLWQDISAEPLKPGPWKFHKDYWAGVEARVLDVLRLHNGLGRV